MYVHMISQISMLHMYFAVFFSHGNLGTPLANGRSIRDFRACCGTVPVRLRHFLQPFVGQVVYRTVMSRFVKAVNVVVG